MDKKRKLDPGANKLGPLKRFARLRSDATEAQEVQVGVVDRETRTVTFSFSSETACPFYYGEEILSHQAGAARMQRINAGGPLLFNHDMNDLLGVVEKAWIGADRRGYVTVRFGADERGEWAMNQVNDRILQNVSFWYRVYAYQTDVDSDIYTATDWEPYEISLVTVPADASVGVGRSTTNDDMDVMVHVPDTNPASADNTEDDEMFKKKHIKRNAVEATRSAGAAASAPAQVVDPAAIEHARVAEIEGMCRTHQIADETVKLLVTLRTPIEQARGIVMNEVLARGRGVATLGGGSNPDMSEREKAKYSMLRAINAAVKERLGEANAWKEAGFEREVSQSIGKRSGKETAGVFIPTNVQFAARAADYSVSGGGSGGGSLVATNLMSGSMIELLRNKARVFGLGAQMLSGLVGSIDIPRQKASGLTYWVGEGGVLSQTGAQFDKVSLSPKHIGALSVVTRNMLQQSTPDVDMLARADLLSTLALGIDLAALSGTGMNNQPLGIANQPGVNPIIGGVNGANITIDHLIDMETLVADANADSDSMAYLANARTVGALKKLKSANGEYLWTGSPIGQRSGTPGEINGYAVARTNQARKNLTKGTGTNLSEVFFGDWSQVLVGEWGVVEILPNPYAAGVYEQGGIELRVMQTLDIAIRHAQAFSVMSDAITSPP